MFIYLDPVIISYAPSDFHLIFITSKTLAAAAFRVLFAAMDVASNSKHRRDAAATKKRILAAAKRCFSEVGYAGMGIRDVAAEAGVSYALLGRYYGSKAGLLEAALIDGTDIAMVIDTERATFGEHLAGMIARALFDDPLSTAMTSLSAADPDAQEVAMRVVKQYVVQPLADWIGEPYGWERALAITMLGGGFQTYSKLFPLIEGSFDQNHPIVRWLARTYQEILDDTDSWRAAPRLA